MPKITKVTVERGSPYTEYALMWESEGARFHVWMRDDKQVTSNRVGLLGTVLFKNAPLGVHRGDAGFFETRRLKLSIAKNKAMFEAALAEAKREGLFAKADGKLATNEQERLAKAAAADRITLAQEAGPNMLRVLKAIDDFWSGGQSQYPLNPGALITEKDEETIADAVRAAIAEAEGKV